MIRETLSPFGCLANEQEIARLKAELEHSQTVVNTLNQELAEYKSQCAVSAEAITKLGERMRADSLIAKSYRDKLLEFGSHKFAFCTDAGKCCCGWTEARAALGEGEEK